MIIRTLTAIVASTALLTACATHEVDYQGEGEGFVGEGSAVQARLENGRVQFRPVRRPDPEASGRFQVEEDRVSVSAFEQDAAHGHRR